MIIVTYDDIDNFVLLKIKYACTSYKGQAVIKLRLVNKIQKRQYKCQNALKDCHIVIKLYTQFHKRFRIIICQ